ncbi:MAG: hypothetical protein KGJ90_04115 [Patescibacteria group bacterium]|nr:hypothetical protein [Patescibacteria group bacterium]
MNDQEKIMKVESVLPENFDGIFQFTNFSDEDFTTKWDSKEYTFPARTRSPMIMPESNSLQIQQIRKIFAKRLAEREFLKTPDFESLVGEERNKDGSARFNSINQASSYGIDRLVSLIQRCLEPLEPSRAAVKMVPKTDISAILSRNEDGELNTEVIDGSKNNKLSLKERARQAQ